MREKSDKRAELNDGAAAGRMTSINELREGALLPAPWAHFLRFFSLCFPGLTASAEQQESENEGRRDDRDCRFARSLSSSGILVRIWGGKPNKAALITRTNEKQTGARIFPENARQREGTLYSKTTPLPRSSGYTSVAAVNHVQVGGFLRSQYLYLSVMRTAHKARDLRLQCTRSPRTFTGAKAAASRHAAGRYVLIR